MLRTSLAVSSLALLLAACSGTGATEDEGGHDEASTVPEIDGGASHDAATDATIDDEASVEASVEAAIEASSDAAGLGAADGGSPDGALDGSYAGPCGAGAYTGMGTGLYTSHLTGVGIPIPFDGNVTLTLDPAGPAGTTCVLQGVSKDCSDVLTVQGGTFSGTADAVHSDAGTFGGFPFSCTITGALDCSAGELVDGWMQCVYCVGPVLDGGTCTEGIGGHFAGPMTASYVVAMKAFVMGTWNGAEALAGNDGTMPGPDGGPISAFLSDSGVYEGPNNFGGSGTWSAAQ
jgi:hypothetical protein